MAEDPHDTAPGLRPNEDADADRHPEGDAVPNPYWLADHYADANLDRDADAHPDAIRHANRYAHGLADANRLADAYSNADLDTHHYPDT